MPQPEQGKPGQEKGVGAEPVLPADTEAEGRDLLKGVGAGHGEHLPFCKMI